MDRLPRACADVIGADRITLGAAVHEMEQLADGRVAVHHGAAGEPEVFDRVIAAIPPAALRMIRTPRWPVTKEHAIRALHFEPLYKIGMRFRTRFWERVTNPSRGGQSITDLPSRWFVYPSYGIGDDGPGVLLLYAWMTDAAGWSPQSEADRCGSRCAIWATSTAARSTWRPSSSPGSSASSSTRPAGRRGACTSPAST